MWPSFFKAFFVFNIVMGFDEIALGIYYAFKGRPKVMTVRWLLRGTSWVAMASLGLWLANNGYLSSWDEPGAILIAFLPVVTFWIIEIYIKVGIEHQSWSSVFDKPVAPRQSTQRDYPSTTRSALMFGLMTGLIMLEFAVVASIVSPELLSVVGWIAVVALASLFGLALGLYFVWVNRVTSV